MAMERIGDIRTRKVIERALKVVSVIAQLHILEDDFDRECANRIHLRCHEATVKSEEDERAWQNVFHNLFPITKENAEEFLNGISDLLPKA
ncbi:MAG: hypothetical protein K6B65_05130 [Bacilli bacterium]|nr:hypothetical protein [Bacilli bacterium]